MLKILKVVAITLMVGGFTGCVKTDDIQVDGELSKSIITSEYKTYSFLQREQTTSNIKGVNILDDKDINNEIQQIINNELEQKGKKLVSEAPDFYIAYIVGTAMNHVNEKLNQEGKDTLEKTPKGAIAFIIIDANTGEVIGMSTAEGDVKNLPEDQKKKRFTYAIKEMINSL